MEGLQLAFSWNNTTEFSHLTYIDDKLLIKDWINFSNLYPLLDLKRDLLELLQFCLGKGILCERNEWHGIIILGSRNIHFSVFMR